MKVSARDDFYSKLSFKVRLQVLLALSAIAVFYALWFGVNHWLKGFMQPAVVNMAMAVMISINAAIAFRRPDCRVPRLFMVLISSMFFLYLFGLGIAGDGAAMWGLIVPIASFFLGEFRTGLLTSFVYLGCCVAITCLSSVYPDTLYVYQPIFINRFFGVYAMIFVIAGGYEYCRGKNEHSLIELLNEARRAQTLISESETKYRALFDGSGHGIIVSRSCDGEIIEANPTAEKMFDFTTDELMQRQVSTLYEHSSAEAEIGPSCDQKGREVWHAGNLSCFRRDGSRFYADLFVTRIFPGELDFTVHFFSDVTERMLNELELKSAREKACAASEAKSNFLANISHEIRTPLNGIIGVSDLLNETSLSSEQREFLDMVRSSGVTLLSLINDVLDLSQIEAGRTELKPEEFELASFFREVTMEMRLRGLQKGLLFDFDLSGEPSHIYCDKLRLKQVLHNLLANAIKFTDSGRVGLNVNFASYVGSDSDQFMRVEVADSGIGISPENVKMLFQDFHQVDSGRTRKYGGTGLGLAISRRLVMMMGGEIGVESELGRGSRFWFRIPVNAC